MKTILLKLVALVAIIVDAFIAVHNKLIDLRVGLINHAVRSAHANAKEALAFIAVARARGEALVTEAQALSDILVRDAKAAAVDAALDAGAAEYDARVELDNTPAKR